MDFVCFSINNWSKRKARKQQFMAHFSLRSDVGKVMYVEPPLNIWRLLLLPFSELNSRENRKRWRRALFFKTEKISDKLYLLTPIFFIPFSFRIQAIYNVNLFLTYLIVRVKLKKMDFKDIVLWLYHPFDYKLLYWFGDKKLACFDWAEEWAEYFMEYSLKKRIDVKVLEDKIIAGADVVFVVSKRLLDMAKGINNNSYQIYDGTVPEIFLKDENKIPDDMKAIKHPIAGYAGTFYLRMDLDLIEGLCERLPECSFVFVGNVMLKPGEISRLKNKKNIFFLGGKEYEKLPGYLMNFDVCILPYTPVLYTSPPTKIYDYLATGNPVVSVYLTELEGFDDLIKLARDKEQFVNYVKESLNEDNPDKRKMRIKKAKENSWFTRTEEIMKILGKYRHK